MVSFKGRHFDKNMILQSVRWYLAYSLSYRDFEEMMAERGFYVDHSTINRWVVHYAPQLEKAFHGKKRCPGDRWRMDETYLKVKGAWYYYYRAVDKQGNTIDFLLTKHRNKKAALRFFNKAIGRNGKPGLINRMAAPLIRVVPKRRVSTLTIKKTISASRSGSVSTEQCHRARPSEYKTHQQCDVRVP